MSKRKKNYPDPGLIVQNYGADALRLALCLNVNECVYVCVSDAWMPVAGFCMLAYLMSLTGIILKGLNHYPCLTMHFPSPTYCVPTLTHTHAYTYCFPSYIHSFALSSERAMDIWPNE